MARQKTGNVDRKQRAWHPCRDDLEFRRSRVTYQLHRFLSLYPDIAVLSRVATSAVVRASHVARKALNDPILKLFRDAPCCWDIEISCLQCTRNLVVVGAVEP